MDNVVPGKLKLKGGLSLKKKSKKRKRKSKEKEKTTEERSSKVTKSIPEETNKSEEEDLTIVQPELTPAQERFEKIKKKREEERLKKMAEKGYRERINEYNDKLAQLSEHHDVPKVGNAGMG